MSGFREGRFDVLVATDIAARGLDVAGVDYVINFDPPNSPETYTHRIGRTGRSDASGKACTFVTREDRDWVRDTERVLGTPIERRTVPGFAIEDLDAGPRGGGASPSRSSGGRQGRGARSGQGQGQTRNGSRGEGGRRRRSSSRGSGSSKPTSDRSRRRRR